MAAAAAVAGGHDVLRARAPGVDDAGDGARREQGAVGEDYHRCADVGGERREACA
jgi:hypothetical protein